MSEETATPAEGGQGEEFAPNTEVSGGSEPEGQGEVAFTLDDGTPVTVEEARNGYLRQRDYTRKTQEVAETRKQHEADLALAQWINENPIEAVDWLAEQVAPLREGQEAEGQKDPIQQELDELRGLLTQQQERDRANEVMAEIGRLQREVGEFDPEELLAHAVERNIPDLEVALIHMNAVKAKAQGVSEAQRLANEKAGLPPAGGRNPGGSQVKTIKNPTVAQALAETMQELGISRLPPPD
jgi:hypothetical protein